MDNDQKVGIYAKGKIHSLDLERINLAAERLNVEVLDILAYQVFSDLEVIQSV